jgi:hypothetical protein
VHAPWGYHAPSSSAKTAIYQKLTTNSLILERESGRAKNLCVSKKKRRAKNLITKGVERWWSRRPALLESLDGVRPWRTAGGRCVARMERKMKKE